MHKCTNIPFYFFGGSLHPNELLIHDFIPKNQTNNLGLAQIVLIVRVVCL